MAAVILLVDDSDLVRGLAKELLVEANYAVLEAGDAREALALTENVDLTLDLLIADLRLPGPSGLDLARAMREARPELKILLVSADATNSAVAELIPGAVFLDKTRLFDRLIGVVGKLLPP